LVQAVGSFTFYDLQQEPDARFLLIAYGITARSALAAASSLGRSGTPVSVLTLKTLWPIPVGLIKKIASIHRQVVVVEMNLGQYVHDIRGIITDRPVKFFGRMDGNLITPTQIEEFLANV
jgi:2-oxoglutarate ferredoxin oxidoreductase subunit alpha